MAIGQCDNCGLSNVPGDTGEACGIEGFFCHVCRDDEFDPYGEIVEPCSKCGGDGGHEVWTHYDPRDGSPLGYWQTCTACSGSGDFVAEVQPITLHDLDLMGKTMLLDRTNHNRLAEQFAARIAPVIPATDRTVTRGDNNPPSRLDYASEAMEELRAFLKGHPVIGNQAEAKAGSACNERTLVALNEARAERETKTRPLRDQLNAIFATYDLVKDKGTLEAARGELRKRLTKYANDVEAARIAEAERLRKAAEEQERIAREAEAAEQDAIAGADVGECTDVASAIEQADQAFTQFQRADRQAAIAERNVPVRFSSVTGGRSQAMRTVEVLVIGNIDLAIKAMGMTDKIRDAILSSARDYRKAYDELPEGITATHERSL